MAVRITNFGVGVGFVTKPIPPDVPGLMVGICPDVRAVCHASAIVVLRDDVKEVNFRGSVGLADVAWKECV